MKNEKKSSYLLNIFSAGMFILTSVVAAYSYAGEQPLKSALIAVGCIMASVLVSTGNVWATKAYRWKQWTAYVSAGSLLLVTAVVWLAVWSNTPVEPAVQWWLDVSVGVVFASLMVTLFAADVAFDNGGLEKAVRMEIHDFRFIPETWIMNSKKWNADQEFLLKCVPHMNSIRAFAGAGDDVVKVLSLVMSYLHKLHGYCGMTFDPEKGTQRLPSGKVLHQCVATTRTESTLFSFVLDPQKGEGIMVTAPCSSPYA